VNAGTVEFIADEAGDFYFMEMNTRLQVEHPVTEMITGLDLVEWQLRIASGEKIPLKQEQLAVSGHAIEARIYAEDPRRDFLPATGRLLHLAFPAQNAEVRVDTGVEAGGEITPWYDPMIAKLIVHGRDRGDALARLRTALAEVEIAGVTTNVEFLRKVAASRAFGSAELDTGLIERNRAELISSIDLDPFLATAAFAELAREEAEARRQTAATGDPFSPWHHVDGWQLNAEAHHDFVFVEGGTEHPVRVRFGDDGPRISIAGREYHGKSTKTRAVLDGNDWHVLCDGVYRRLSLKSELAGDAAEAAGSLTAPMPGRIVKVMTKPGAKVGKGEALLILEAMKMEHTITAPADGKVKTVHYAAGEQVLEGAELVTLE
jgi:3-methylcrotonyl-CoA carboxylase alpha subunit